MFCKTESAIVSNLRFMSGTNFMLSWVEQEKSYITLGSGFRGIDTHSGKKTLSKLFCPLLKRKWSSLFKMNLYPEFFLYRVDPFSEGVWCAIKRTGSHKSCLPWRKWRNVYQVYPVPLTFTILLANSGDHKLVIFFLFFLEKSIWHFMQIVTTGDTLHEMSDSVFWEK